MCFFSHCTLNAQRIVTIKSANYRPQRSWGKVMFLHVSVILSTISGGRRNTYGWQAGGTHPTGMLSCISGWKYSSQLCVLGITSFRLYNVMSSGSFNKKTHHQKIPSQ